MSLLKLQDIGKIYVSEGTVAVGIRGVNLEFDIGEFVAVTGKSGSGKTTLLNIISGMDTYEEGELYIEGEPTSHYAQSDWEVYRQKYISFIFQEYNIIDSFTVLQNVELALSDIESSTERRRRALELIERVGLTKFKNHKGSKLSGGQKQRTVIARALAKDSPIILADEPTGNLDSQTSKEIIELLAEISKEKLVVIVTHSFSQVEEYATREIRIFDGAVERDETLRQCEKKSFVEQKAKQTKKKTFTRGVELGRHRFTAMPKLSVFMCLLMVIAMLGTFFVTVLCVGDLSAFDKYYMFTPMSGRAVIVRQDGELIGDNELKDLASRVSANAYLHYDALLDNSVHIDDYSTDTYYSARLYYVYDESIQPDVGRRPEASDEALLVLPIQWQQIYGKDSLLRDYVTLYGSYRLKVVGVKYYYDNTQDYGSKIVLTQEGFEEMSAIDFFNNNNYNSRTEVKLDCALNYGNYQDNYGYVVYTIMIDNTLADDEYYFTSYDHALVDAIKGEKMGVTAEIKATFTVIQNEYYGSESRTEYSLSDAKLNTEKCAVVSDAMYYKEIVYGEDIAIIEEISETLYISPALANDIVTSARNNSYSQASLFFEDDRAAEASVDTLRELGYVAVPSNTTYLSADMAIMNYIEAIVMIFVWLLMILFLALFLSLCSSRAIMAKKGDIAILRSMGIRNNVIKISMYTQMFIAMIPSFILLAVAAITVYTIPATNPIFPFLHAPQYVLIIIGMVILNLFVTRRYNKKMFRDSVRKTLKGGDKA